MALRPVSWRGRLSVRPVHAQAPTGDITEVGEVPMTDLDFRLCVKDRRVHEWPEDQRTEQRWTARCGYTAKPRDVAFITLGVPCLDCFIKSGAELAESGTEPTWRDATS